MKRLCEALKDHADRGDLSCHMPGHKENKDTFLGEILKYDITETEGMDNLHDASGVILESERYAAALYGAEETHFLINGSTVGIISAILALTHPGDEILIARNCHKSVYNAVMAGRLICRYIYPSFAEGYGFCNAVSAEALREALNKYPEVKAVVITSPTYEGIVSDIEALALVSHEHSVPLIVDAAHGAHFGFYEGFPQSAVKAGADIVINSVHKTLPAPTQTALIHIGGPYGNSEKVRRMLGIYQSSSPSYLLMAGIDGCMSIVADKGRELFGAFLENLSRFERRAKDLKKLRYLDRNALKSEFGAFEADPCKVVISTSGTGMTGRELYEELRTVHHIEPEMAAGTYCLLIMTIMDDREAFERVINAIECIDEKMSGRDDSFYEGSKVRTFEEPEQVMQAYEAAGEGKRKVKLKEACGLICAGHIMPYPPGIPLIVPGERINESLINRILDDIDTGLNVTGISKDREIEVYG
ncbi:MAG: aminotransferase class I/II-fold pyridoxal phosphate-dependent enzyme [Lachnospiraceae bacterium]|nr:aminotransferase class I/II-fold pyridoxal phosphate-dependent enzyme [Lachnospiraceae bacterium]